MKNIGNFPPLIPSISLQKSASSEEGCTLPITKSKNQQINFALGSSCCCDELCLFRWGPEVVLVMASHLIPSSAVIVFSVLLAAVLCRAMGCFFWKYIQLIICKHSEKKNHNQVHFWPPNTMILHNQPSVDVGKVSSAVPCCGKNQPSGAGTVMD